MQSLSSRVRPSLGRHCGWHVRKIDKAFLAPQYLCRQSLFLSNRGGSKLHLTRYFSGNASKAGSSTSARSSFFGWYSKKLDTHPISTKCVSAGLVSSIGSILAQVIAHRQDQRQHVDGDEKENAVQEPFEIDLERVSRFVVLNIVYVAPVLHHWYEFVNRALPGRSFSRVLQRTFCDEFLFSPIYIPVLLGILWKSEGKTNDTIWKMIKSELPTILVTEWAMWVPTMIVTFRYVPVKFQVLVVNVVGVVWNTFLAYAVNNAHSSSSESDNEGDKESTPEQAPKAGSIHKE